MWKTKKWSAKAVELVERYIYEADSLTFKYQAYLKDHFFGSLLLRTNTGKQIAAADILRQMLVGLDAEPRNFAKGKLF